MTTTELPTTVPNSRRAAGRGLRVVAVALLTIGITAWLAATVALPLASQQLSAGDYLTYVSWNASTSSVMVLRPSENEGTARKILEVAHAEGMPVRASISSDSRWLAYTRAPIATSRPWQSGELWLFNLAQAQPVRIDTAIDPSVAPKWSIDGDELLYTKIQMQSSDKYITTLMWSDVGGSNRQIFVDSESLALSPLGFSSPKKFVYVQRVMADGDGIWSIDLATGAVRKIAQLSVTSTWNARISADGRFMIGSVQVSQQPPSFSLLKVDLASGAISSIARGSGRHYTAIWSPNDLIVSDSPGSANGPQLLETASTGGVNVRRLAPMSASEQLTPESVSPDQEWTVLSHFSATEQDLRLLQRNATGSTLIGKPDHAEFVGWLRVTSGR